MGYYTKYTLHAYNAETRDPITEAEEKVIAKRVLVLTGGGRHYAPYYFENVLSDEMKWYDHEEDMLDLSTEYPHILFVLEGIGEEFPDAWRKWFHNGKYEESCAEITYPKPSNPLFAAFNF